MTSSSTWWAVQCLSCADPEIFVRGGPTLKSFFSWGEGGSKNHYKRATIGQPVKPHKTYRWWPNIECWLGSFVIFRGSRPVLLRNPIFCDFSGGSEPCPHSGSTHAYCINMDENPTEYKGLMPLWCMLQTKHEKDHSKSRHFKAISINYVNSMRGSRNFRQGGSWSWKSNGQFQRNLSIFKVPEWVQHLLLQHYVWLDNVNDLR